MIVQSTHPITLVLLTYVYSYKLPPIELTLGFVAICRNIVINVFQIYADSVIIFSMYRIAKLIAENCGEPVYFYDFTYQGRYSFTRWNATTPYGKI